MGGAGAGTRGNPQVALIPEAVNDWRQAGKPFEQGTSSVRGFVGLLVSGLSQPHEPLGAPCS